MFFSSWESLLKLIIVGISAYAGLVILLRISGKRTLTSMNIFDLVVTVAFGSTLASTMVSKSVTLSDGLLALALLIGLQFLVAYSVVRFPRIERVVKSEPTLLMHKGEMLLEAMRRERIGKEEVIAAVRKHGQLDLNRVEAVVLETDGSMSVIASPGHTVQWDSLQDVSKEPDRNGT